MKRLIVVPALLVATAALAAGDGAVSLSPAVITLRGEAGQSTRQNLSLRNGTSRTLSFTVEADDVIVRDGHRVFAPDGSTPGSIAATAVFSATKVTVASGQTASVSVTVTIPPGSKERAVVALFRGTDKFMNGNVASTASLGALLTFTLSDGVAMTADPLVVQPQTATSNLSVTQSCLNAGPEPFLTRGMLAVIGDDGRLVGKSALQPRRLLPGERTTLGAEYGAELRPGHYRLLLTYDYEGHALSQSAEVVVR